MDAGTRFAPAAQRPRTGWGWRMIAALAWGIAAAVSHGAATAADAGSACTSASSITFAQRLIQRQGAAVETTQTALPDRLPLRARSENASVRYALDVSGCRHSSAAALWLFRVGAPYRITADGEPLVLLSARPLLRLDLLAGDWLPPQRGVYNGRIPALFALPAGARSVTVELQTLPYLPAGLVEARLGPVNLLMPLQAGAVEDVVAHADVASVVVLVLGVLALMLWLRRRADSALLWLAIACGLWGLRGLAYFNHAVYVSPTAFEQFNPLNVLLASAALMTSTAHVLGGLSRREGTVLSLAVAACLALLIAAAIAGTGAGAARAACLAASLTMTAWLVVQLWRRREALSRWHAGTLIAAFVGLLGCAVHDLMVVGGALAPSEPSWVFWGFVVLLVGFAVVSGQYVVTTLNRAERSNEELERHVERKTRELEHSYALLRESERETARAQERGRLLRDMHDGLGAHLMSTLRGVERGALGPADLARSLQDGLDELRLLMDSTDMGQYLPSALAAWRNRWDARLAAAGVTLDWTIHESLDQIELNNDVALQVMRILQEAATNIIKHAQATRMSLHASVAASESGSQLRIEIVDDGVGFRPGQARAGGRGLKNMHYRAGQIGATLDIGALDGREGTRVLLCVPAATTQDTRPRLDASMAASALDEIPNLR
ncbi:MAG TPA: ATP-binding protein [Ramlibacter sp.]|nr:ATP-binding protein [Ramlibacter sp.]